MTCSQIQSGWRSASKARIAERRAELVWRFWEDPIPLLCIVYQDVLIDIVPQLGISTVFGQIHLSITPHIHEFSRAHLGFKKKRVQKLMTQIANLVLVSSKYPNIF